MFDGVAESGDYAAFFYSIVAGHYCPALRLILSDKVERVHRACARVYIIFLFIYYIIYYIFIYNIIIYKIYYIK